jgi:hypothetical protein
MLVAEDAGSDRVGKIVGNVVVATESQLMRPSTHDKWADIDEHDAGRRIRRI